jgi:hypothetical protein
MAVSVKTSDVNVVFVITGCAGCEEAGQLLPGHSQCHGRYRDAECECEWDDQGNEATCAYCVGAVGAARAAHEAKVAEEEAKRGHVLATEAFYRG